MSANQILPRKKNEDGEFLWLVSLSDLMILLFIFFVVMFSFAYKKDKQNMLKEDIAAMRKEKLDQPNPVDMIKTKFNAWTVDQKLQEQISVKRNEDSVQVEIKDRLLFESGAYLPTPEGLRVLQLLSKTLQGIPEPFRIGIEGHTDDVPIHTSTLRDNWDLSARRALEVMYALHLPPAVLKRIVIMANADNKPLAPNRSPAGVAIPENQSRNRRVTLRIF